MKPVVLISAAIVFVVFAVALATRSKAEDTKAIMRVKLEHSKALLEGLATENYAQLEGHANELTLLSLETDWNVLQTGEYRRLSEDFRRSTTSLTEAAKAKNLDGATLAYMGVTMKCVECHKYVRSVNR